MQNYNGMVVADRTAALSQAGDSKDLTPRQFRHWTNLGYHDVQLHNGLGRGVGNGKWYPYIDQMHVWAFIPRIPGQTRGNVAGFPPRGPSPYNVQDWMMSGPGSQPEHPGGPGQIAATTIYNPMGG